jgi:hypothetical protein
MWTELLENFKEIFSFHPKFSPEYSINVGFEMLKVNEVIFSKNISYKINCFREYMYSLLILSNIVLLNIRFLLFTSVYSPLCRVQD